MRPTSSNQRWFAATVCLLASTGFAAGQEGVVQMSDATTRPGVVRMSAMQQPLIRQTAYAANGAMNGNFQALPYQGHQFAGNQQMVDPRNAYHSAIPYQGAGLSRQSSPSLSPLHQTSYSLGGHSCGCGTNAGCGPECCGQSCYGRQGGCNSVSCDDRCDTRRGQRKMNKNGSGSCDSCYYGDGYQERMVTLFAKATPKNGCNNQGWLRRSWRGQQYNYLARNQRLSNHLFGWLVPSGCCGQGCPPFGKYCVTYADNAGNSNCQSGGQAYGGQGYGGPSASGQGYGVQGYGVPMSVPLAPNVRQAYNYSWGTPSSRITPIGNNNGGGGSPQQLYHQSW